MVKMAVVKTGGKQYLVKENDEITVDRLEGKEEGVVKLETLARFDNDKADLELGKPLLKDSVESEIVSHDKGIKIRVARFKAKVRYRKVKGFRPQLTKLKIIKI